METEIKFKKCDLNLVEYEPDIVNSHFTRKEQSQKPDHFVKTISSIRKFSWPKRIHSLQPLKWISMA